MRIRIRKRELFLEKSFRSIWFATCNSFLELSCESGRVICLGVGSNISNSNFIAKFFFFLSYNSYFSFIHQCLHTQIFSLSHLSFIIMMSLTCHSGRKGWIYQLMDEVLCQNSICIITFDLQFNYKAFLLTFL